MISLIMLLRCCPTISPSSSVHGREERAPETTDGFKLVRDTMLENQRGVYETSFAALYFSLSSTTCCLELHVTQYLPQMVADYRKKSGHTLKGLHSFDIFRSRLETLTPGRPSYQDILRGGVTGTHYEETLYIQPTSNNRRLLVKAVVGRSKGSTAMQPG